MHAMQASLIHAPSDKSMAGHSEHAGTLPCPDSEVDSQSKNKRITHNEPCTDPLEAQHVKVDACQKDDLVCSNH